MDRYSRTSKQRNVNNKGNKIIIDPEGITAEFNADYGYGVVIEQEPSANMQVKDNKITSLVLSLGNERIFMPDVVYKSKREAETTIRSVVGDEYTIGFIEMSHEYAHFEQVIKTEPEAGQLVTDLEGGYDIKVYYCESENPSEIRMPDLIGMSYEEARRLIEQGGVSVDNEKVTAVSYVIPVSDFEKGYVIIKKGKKVFHKIIK